MATTTGDEGRLIRSFTGRTAAAIGNDVYIYRAYCNQSQHSSKTKERATLRIRNTRKQSTIHTTLAVQAELNTHISYAYTYA